MIRETMMMIMIVITLKICLNNGIFKNCALAKTQIIWTNMYKKEEGKEQ